MGKPLQDPEWEKRQFSGYSIRGGTELKAEPSLDFGIANVAGSILHFRLQIFGKAAVSPINRQALTIQA